MTEPTEVVIDGLTVRLQLIDGWLRVDWGSKAEGDERYMIAWVDRELKR